MKNLILASETLPEWATTLLPILRSVFVILLLVGAVSIIIICMMMESNPEGGSNVVTGNYDSFFAKNKASTREGRMKRILIAVSIVMVVCSILFFVIERVWPGIA